MPRAPVKSAIRVLDVLALFSRERRPLSQNELVQKLNFPQSSTAFLLRSLIEAGYMSFDRTRRVYFPTPEVLRISKWLEAFGFAEFFEHSVITRMLEELRSATQETAAIASQNDLFAHFHRVLDSNLSVKLYLPEGTNLPLTYSSYGLMLLSTQSDEQIDRTCRLINARHSDPQLKTDVKTIVSRMKEVRTAGYCYLRNPYLLGASSIATLIPLKVLNRHVAVGIGGVTERMEERFDWFKDFLLDTVKRYSGELEHFQDDSPLNPAS
jgi:DNA-binding IclR family transcriptional regulator